MKPGGRDVVLTRDGVPVARVVRELPPPKPGKRVLTPRQEEALRPSMAILEKGWPLDIGKLDKNELYDDMLGVKPTEP